MTIAPVNTAYQTAHWPNNQCNTLSDHLLQKQSHCVSFCHYSKWVPGTDQSAFSNILKDQRLLNVVSSLIMVHATLVDEKWWKVNMVGWSFQQQNEHANLRIVGGIWTIFISMNLWKILYQCCGSLAINYTSSSSRMSIFSKGRFSQANAKLIDEKQLCKSRDKSMCDLCLNIFRHILANHTLHRVILHQCGFTASKCFSCVISIWADGRLDLFSQPGIHRSRTQTTVPGGTRLSSERKIKPWLYYFFSLCKNTRCTSDHSMYQSIYWHLRIICMYMYLILFLSHYEQNMQNGTPQLEILFGILPYWAIFVISHQISFCVRNLCNTGNKKRPHNLLLLIVSSKRKWQCLWHTPPHRSNTIPLDIWSVCSDT